MEMNGMEGMEGTKETIYIYILLYQEVHTTCTFVTFEKERNRHTSTDIHTQTQHTHNHI